MKVSVIYFSQTDMDLNFKHIYFVGKYIVMYSFHVSCYKINKCD